MKKIGFMTFSNYAKLDISWIDSQLLIHVSDIWSGWLIVQILNFRGYPWSNWGYSMWSVSQIQGQLTISVSFSLGIIMWLVETELSAEPGLIYMESLHMSKWWCRFDIRLYVMLLNVSFLMTFWHTLHVPDKFRGWLLFQRFGTWISILLCLYFLQEDVELMVETGLDAYRFSISWSRLIPSMVTNCGSW